MNPNPPMYVLQTRHEHTILLETHFFNFAGRCCHNCVPLYRTLSSPQERSLPTDIESLGFLMVYMGYIFFAIWIFVHEHLRFTGQQEKGEAISLTPHYHFHSLHRYVDIRRAITPKSLPLPIASTWANTGNLCFPSASC